MVIRKPEGNHPLVFENIGSLVSMQGANKKLGRNVTEKDLSIFINAALIIENGRVLWAGEKRDIPAKYRRYERRDLEGVTIVPGFVECHTHTVFAGTRSNEFEMRNQGATYQDIAAKGGGILSTVNATRKALSKDLVELAQKRVNTFAQQGVTTLEIKSGYGLSFGEECKLLMVIQELRGPKIVSTFLGPHAIAPEYDNTELGARDYIENITFDWLSQIARKDLTKRVDIFVEKGYFSPALAKKYFEKAKSLGFQITIHADQLTLSGGTELAIEVEALSADHVIQITDEEIQKLAKSKTVAVLLPTSDLYLKMKYPPARKLIDAGACVALATDFNPGTSPTQDLALVGLLARLEMKMTLPEVLSAYTVGAAHALGLQDEIGSIEPGKHADFAIFDCDWRDLFYMAGGMKPVGTFRGGKKLKFS